MGQGRQKLRGKCAGGSGAGVKVLRSEIMVFVTYSIHQKVMALTGCFQMQNPCLS